MNAPLNTIEPPKYTKEELQARNDALVGLWERIKTINSALISQMNAALTQDGVKAEKNPVLESEIDEFKDAFLNKPFNRKLRLYRDDLDTSAHNEKSGGEILLRSIQHCWPNGPGLHLQIDFRKKDEDPEVNAHALIESFDKVTNPEKRRQVLKDYQGDPRDLFFDYSIKSRRETLGDYPREIEKWVAANADVILPDSQQVIATEIANYRAAYQEMMDYLEYAKGYLAHQAALQHKDNKAELGDGWERE